MLLFSIRLSVLVFAAPSLARRAARCEQDRRCFASRGAEDSHNPDASMSLPTRLQEDWLGRLYRRWLAWEEAQKSRSQRR